MSGGVDSSAAALLLKEKGYNLIGIFMRLGTAGQESVEEAARQAAAKLGIKFYPLNLAEKFREEVISYFVKSYAAGLTPNPCVKCNRIIKFGQLLKLTRQIGADYLATGHYARSRKTRTGNKSVIKLYRGKDKDKDQSYFLYNLTQRQLAWILFPLGHYRKDEVKKLARKADLPHIREESQDVCFFSGEHNDFLRQHLNLKPGPIILRGQKKAIGRHQGLPLYTIGQRRGIEIGGRGPFYVWHCDYKKNILYVVADKDDPALYRDSLTASQVNWIAGQAPALPLKCQAVIRYRHKPVDCEIKKQGRALKVEFKKAQRAVTPGQSVVFYQGEEVLGGGIIA